MDRQQLTDILNDLKDGRIEVDDALGAIRKQPIADLGFANLDLHRSLRCGFPEVVFAQGKTVEQFLSIVERIVEENGCCFSTRVREKQADAITNKFPNNMYDEQARTIWIGDEPEVKYGSVQVVTAGTADIPVAKEAYQTARVMGSNVSLICDVGVAGLHRILSRLDDIQQADCLIVVAGMEGALPSVVGGLVDVPVIAVPTSVGYGASMNGIAALLGMLNSCSSNVCVVNIDNGFSAGYIASLMVRKILSP